MSNGHDATNGTHRARGAELTGGDAWQQPCGPDDRLQLAYLGLTFAFGTDAPRADLLARAREAAARTTFYRSEWVAGRAFDDVQVTGTPAARLHSALAEARGAVVCTFQIGPFLQLPFALSEADLAVMLLMDSDVFELGMDVCAIEGIGRGGSPYGWWPARDGDGRARASRPVTFLKSSDPSAAWRMAQWLKSGGVVFGYLDGNRGLDEDYTDRNSVVVPFFGAEIWVRKGLPYLAAFAGAPLLFMVCRQDEDRHVVEVSPPLRRRQEESVAGFCGRAIAAGFRLLQTHIRRDPACWNEWAQVHRWVVRRGRAADGTPAVERSPEEVLRQALRVEPRIVQIRLGAHDVLVNLRTGAAVVSTPAITAVLELARHGATVGEVLDGLSATFEEALLLDIVHELATAAFLGTRA